MSYSNKFLDELSKEYNLNNENKVDYSIEDSDIFYDNYSNLYKIFFIVKVTIANNSKLYLYKVNITFPIPNLLTL